MKRQELINALASLLESDTKHVEDILAYIGFLGLIVVSVEPTEEMIEEGWYEANEGNAAGVWRDMLQVVMKDRA